MLFLDACSVLIRFHPRRRAEGRAHRHSVSDLPVLIERICRADPQALAEIFDRQVDRVYAIALKRLRCRHEAEDVCSEVFDRIWRRAEQFDPARGSVEAWIATIARNASLDRLRRQAREPENDAVDSYEVALLLHADPDSGPEQWVDQAAFQRARRSCRVQRARAAARAWLPAARWRASGRGYRLLCRVGACSLLRRVVSVQGRAHRIQAPATV
jgi:RNA polymerase sigma factor (sigma-70 family)